MPSGTDSPSSNSAYAGNRPEELPPVSPPSAGFIVQLFLIPALIVMAVVAVWALFGKLADSESDWKQLVTELGSSNEHRRWRAALGVAQLLRNEEISPPTEREPLARHPLVVDSLTELFSKAIASTSPTDEDITHQEFLARTLGSLDADEKTLPVLAEATKDSHTVEVRKSALMSIATIAGRHFDVATGYKPSSEEKPAEGMAVQKVPLEKPTISDPATLTQLTICAQDPLPVIRHLAGFAIANVGGAEATEQLKLMLLDGDRFARANAAVGLARNGSTDSIPPMIELLNESLQPFNAQPVQGKSEAEQRLAENTFQVEQPQVVRNCLRGISDLWNTADATQKAELKAVVEKVAADFFAPDVRIQANELLKQISTG
jgi:HEAT repeat protein